MKILIVILVVCFYCGCATNDVSTIDRLSGQWVYENDEREELSIMVFEPDGRGGWTGFGGGTALGAPFTYELNNDTIVITPESPGGRSVEAVIRGEEIYFPAPAGVLVHARRYENRYKRLADDLREQIKSEH